MKKLYARPEIEINTFDTEDIMTASGGNNGGMTIVNNIDVGGGSAVEISVTEEA